MYFIVINININIFIKVMGLQEQILKIQSIHNISEIVGYYKYESHNSSLISFVNEYPITEEIIKYMKKLNHIKIEFDGNTPKLINNKLVVLI
jgi:hypothetical protein